MWQGHYGRRTIGGSNADKIARAHTHFRVCLPTARENLMKPDRQRETGEKKKKIFIASIQKKVVDIFAVRIFMNSQ